MKYFSIFAPFTEITGSLLQTTAAILDGLNEALEAYNFRQETEPSLFPLVPTNEQLAFLDATGSGKSLLLHVNIRQYLHSSRTDIKIAYPDQSFSSPPNGVVPPTSEELDLGFDSAVSFDKNGEGVFKGRLRSSTSQLGKRWRQDGGRRIL